MSKQIILGFAGRKQSGKNTCFNLIHEWLPHARECSYAEPLKQMCMDIFGLTHAQVWGSDEDKNEKIPHMLWENFPLQAWVYGDGYTTITYEEPGWLPHMPDDYGWARPKTGPMTAREILQFYGTEIFRKQYPNVWVDACIRNIQNRGYTFAVITDVRFPNEVEGIQKAGGKVIRLTRCPFPDDNHPSERSLDEDRFDHSRFDYILDNCGLDINRQSDKLCDILNEWGFFY